MLKYRLHGYKMSYTYPARFCEPAEKVREELNQVIGDRQVQVEDRKNLPYTDAVIHETQRLANIIPMALPHRTSQDVTFHGYFIKKVSKMEKCGGAKSTRTK